MPRGSQNRPQGSKIETGVTKHERKVETNAKVWFRTHLGGAQGETRGLQLWILVAIWGPGVAPLSSLDTILSSNSQLGGHVFTVFEGVHFCWNCSLIFNDFGDGFCDGFFMLFHRRGRPYSEHDLYTFCLFLWVAFKIVEPSPICVLHNKNNGLRTFSILWKLVFCVILLSYFLS